MLVLTRSLGEKIILGDGVKTPYMDIMVLGIKGNQVRVGLTAPKDIPIYREEVHQRIQTEKLNNIHEPTEQQ